MGVRRTDRLKGLGTLHHGKERLGKIGYTVNLSTTTGQALVVEFAEKPKARDSQLLLHLELEDGRVVNCEMLDNLTYWAVVGEGPIRERRREIRTSSSRSSSKPR